MTLTIEKGDFENIGIKKTKYGITITFLCDRSSKTALRLYDLTDGSVTDIPIPAEYTIGDVRSISISGTDFSNYEYNLIIDDKEKLFTYATSIRGREKWGDTSRLEGECLRGRFIFPDFDAYPDKKPEHPAESLIIYKLNVRGFTRSEKKLSAKKGTFAALEEKIPYLKDLGINAVELMPIYEFNELIPLSATSAERATWNPQAKKGFEMLENPTPYHINLWGYGAGDYHAPKASLASGSDPIAELIHMIYAFHAAGIEVIMEMCFLPGTALAIISEILKFWVKKYHIDGFHLLAPGIDAREIAKIPLLRSTRIFYDNVYSSGIDKDADFGNLYQYRDDFLYTMRKQINFIESNMTATLGAMNNQSSDICYVNYIANNNGFTLRDLFSYSSKHNEENGEKNTDGNDYNYSTNCGAEGATRKQQIIRTRLSLMKLAAAVTFISRGCPLIYMGDEFGNTQNGNNNAYCQDNRIGYLSWDELPKHEEYHSFIKKLIAFRKSHPILSLRSPELFSKSGSDGFPMLSYHTNEAWSGNIAPSLQTIGILYSPENSEDKKLYIALNFSSAMTELSLPRISKSRSLKYVFGTSDYLESLNQGTINIPPHTAWFFEG